MGLSKKDFIRIATDLARDKADEKTVKTVVTICKESNRRFDEERFRNYIAKQRKMMDESKFV